MRPRVVVLLALMMLAGCGGVKGPATGGRFAAGQVWRYKTRPGEEDSRVIIGKVERLEKLGVVVHVKLVKVKVANPSAPGGFSTTINHLPMSAGALTSSVVECVGDDGDLDGFAKGYDTWLAAYRKGEGGIFKKPLNEVVDLMEQTLKAAAKSR